MSSELFVPADFEPPTTLVTSQFRLEPLGPQHNPAAGEHDVIVQSWVRADRAQLDVPLADAVAAWLHADWPWSHIDRCGR